MTSFIVPAHNEEAWVGRCVSAIHSGLESLAEPYEIIVVDDASSDATASIARQQGAQVIRVEHRQIAATRNAGARQARAYSFLSLAWLSTCLILRGSRGFRSRRGLEYWYEPEREKRKL